MYTASHTLFLEEMPTVTTTVTSAAASGATTTVTTTEATPGPTPAPVAAAIAAAAGSNNDNNNGLFLSEPALSVDIKGKVALITGASRGIGAAVAKHLATRGMKLVLCARSMGALEAVATEYVYLPSALHTHLFLPRVGGRERVHVLIVLC